MGLCCARLEQPRDSRSGRARPGSTVAWLYLNLTGEQANGYEDPFSAPPLTLRARDKSVMDALDLICRLATAQAGALGVSGTVVFAAD